MRRTRILLIAAVLGLVGCSNGNVGSSSVSIPDSLAANAQELESAYRLYADDAADGSIDDLNAYSHLGGDLSTVTAIAETVCPKDGVVLVQISSDQYYYFKEDAWYLSRKELPLDATIARYMREGKAGSKIFDYTYLSYGGFYFYKLG